MGKLLLCLCSLLWLVLILPLNLLAESGESEKYVRISVDENGEPLALQVSITTFERTLKVGGTIPRRIVVDLVGAIHIGDQAYYQSLNSDFANYHQVLYELIADREENVPAPPQGRLEDNSPLSKLQNSFGSILKLTHQLDHVDYTPVNFVHADMSPDAFGSALKSNAKSFDDFFLTIIRDSYSKQFADFEKSQVLGLKIMLSMLSPARSRILRRALAEQLLEVDQISSLMGPLGETIIVDRNKRALAVLRKRLKTTRYRRYAIFYGAGHMPDMAKRLKEEFGMEESGKRWVTAWKLD